jgi:hypothetical protein
MRPSRHTWLFRLGFGALLVGMGLSLGHAQDLDPSNPFNLTNPLSQVSPTSLTNPDSALSPYHTTTAAAPAESAKAPPMTPAQAAAQEAYHQRLMVIALVALALWAAARLSNRRRR